MDEDEREMLSEARARLANTKGKKAKRKAREKQLEEARRLASLQKKRELKAAGIETVKRAKRVRGIDYNAEIAFERKPAPGFYDVTEERLAQPDPFDEKNFKPTTVEEMEGPRKKDLEEKLRAQDVKRQRINERRDAPSAVATTNALNDPSAVRRRSKLMLPEPQVSDRELEEMAKMSGAAMMDVDADDDTPGGALVSRYGVPPASSSGAAAARTPQIGGHDAILQEAQNLRRLAEGQTPLLGGENPTLAGSDFSGITPARRDAPTPNPLAGATPARLRRRDPVRGSPPRGNRFGRGDAASRFAQHQRPGRDAGAAGGTRGEGARDAREERTARKSRVASRADERVSGYDSRSSRG